MDRTVLIIEDDDALQAILKNTFSRNGYNVLTAGNGMEGLDAARQHRPDVVLCDVMLPKMDGFKVCRLLKFDQNLKHIPVVMVTCKGQTPDKATGKAAGADLYLVKPFDLAGLVRDVSGLLAGSAG